MHGLQYLALDMNLINDEKILRLKREKSGDTIFSIWIELLCLTRQINLGGDLLFSTGAPYEAKDIAAGIHRKTPVVKRALDLFITLKMIDCIDGIYHVSRWEKWQDVQRLEQHRREKNAEYCSNYRKKQKSKSNEPTDQDEKTVVATVVQQHPSLLIDEDLEKEIDKEKTFTNKSVDECGEEKNLSYDGQSKRMETIINTFIKEKAQPEVNEADIALAKDLLKKKAKTADEELYIGIVQKSVEIQRACEIAKTPWID